ncbi:MAG TPA: hypothetical protein PKY59_25250, partial [Pyrinomonadaceae bacterium]|nr:hypothetical protein [Pyrinomonadaceae bacterium]
MAQTISIIMNQKSRIFLIIILAASLLFTACDGNNANTNTNANASNTDKAANTNTSKSKEEIERDAEKEKAQIDEAVSKFLKTSYSNWKLEGTAGDLSTCSMGLGEICELHISKNGQNKVVPVLIKKFTNQKQEEYYLVYEARPVDLGKAKLDRIRETEREETLGNLTSDDISDDLKQTIYEEESEALAELA